VFLNSWWQWLILFAVIGWAVSVYNALVRLREQAEAAWADIDVQLKRRHDLVPNLVETVKGYASHEQETFDAVIQARSRAMSADGPAAAGAAESMLGNALGRLFALAEAYPDLKASDGFRDLQNSLSELEGAIQNARRYYNAVVRDLNTLALQFPAVVVAKAMGVGEREYFELEDPREGVAPRVGEGLS